MIKKSSLKTIYIIHGWSYDLQPWQSFLAELKKNKIENKLLRVPGLSQPSSKVWTIKSYLSWLNEELSAESEPVILLGHSNGGRIAMHYALKHPKKVKHLILLNSAGAPLPAAVVRKNKILRKLSKLFSPLKRIGFVRPLVYKILRVQDYYRAKPNMKETMKNMFASDVELRKKELNLSTPVSIVWGKEDQLTPLAMGQYLADRLPNVKQFTVLEGARHSPYATHAEILAEVILKIWQKL